MLNKKTMICLLAAALMLLAFASAEGYPESNHPYENNASATWTYTHSEDAYALKILFSTECSLEQDFDFLYINDTEGSSQCYTGSDLSGAEVWVRGNSFTLLLESDESYTEYGFSIDSITGYSQSEFETANPIELTVDSYGCVTGYTGIAFDLEIPETINDIPVSSIGNNAFEGSVFRTISLPDGITSIGSYAFSHCKTLSSINIPESVSSIGTCAFYNCAALTEITIPEGVIMIQPYTFDNCTSLKSVSLPDGLLSINDAAFQSCKALQEIAIPDSVTSIGNYVFNNCINLTSIALPAGLESLSDDLFYYCKSLVQVEIPSNVTRIGISAFGECSSLQEITIPEGVTEIGESAFYECISLSRVSLPESLETIDSNAFQNCSSLNKIDIPDNVSSINSYAFFESGLVQINLPAHLTTLSNCAFAECALLVQATLPEGLTSIESYAFNNCSSLKYINIPESVTDISWSAFSDCSSLLEISLPAGIPYIADELFQDCTSLAKVSIQNGPNAIYSNAFIGCTALDRLYIPASITEIHSTAFENGVFLLVEQDSYALQFAEANGYDYAIVGDDTPIIYSISSVPAQSGVGESLSWTVETIGGIDVQYAFDLYRNGSIYLSSDWSSSNHFTHEFTLPGLYYVVAHTKNTASDATDSLAGGTVHVRSNNPETMEIYDVALESESETNAGKAICFSFKLRGGDGNYSLFANVSRDGATSQNGSCSSIRCNTWDMGSYFLCRGSIIPAQGGVYGLTMQVLDDSANEISAEIFSGVQVSEAPVVITGISGLDDDRSYYANTASAEVHIELELNRDAEGLIFNWVLMRDNESNTILDQFTTDSPELDYVLCYDGNMRMDVIAYDTEADTYSAPISAYLRVYPMEDYENGGGVLWGVGGYGVHLPGESVNWTAYYSQSDEEGDEESTNESYEFSFTLHREGEVYAESGWIAEDNFSVTLNDLGLYTMECSMRDSEGTVYGPVYDDSIPVIENMIEGVDFYGTFMRYTNSARNKYKWVADYSSESGQPIGYRFDLYKDGEPYLFTDWASDSYYAEFQYTFRETGVYTMYITLRDEQGNTSAPIPFDPVPFTGPVIESVTPCTYNSLLNVGDMFSVNCSARYGAGDLVAVFDLYKDGELIKTSPQVPLKAANESSIPLASWTITLAEAGEYSVSARVLDEKGNWSETVHSRTVSVSGEAYAQPTLDYITVDNAICRVGDRASWTAAAYGGSGSLSYIYSLYCDGELIETFDPQQSATLTYSFENPGYYTIKLIVQDESNQQTAETDGPPVSVGDKLLVSYIEISAPQVFTPGRNFYLHIGTHPANATNAAVHFSIDDESVATVNNSGYVEIIGEGSAVVTVTAEDGGGAQVQCEVESGSGDTIKPPAGITEIKAEAFQNTAPVVVDLYDCDTITFHNSAFSNCRSLKCILMPDNANFGDYSDIFSNNPDLVLFCRNTAQIEYANENGIPYVLIE